MHHDILKLAPELTKGVAVLQTEMWSADPQRNASYLRWKYRDKPCWVAIADGEVVGMRGGFGLTWLDGGRRGRCYSAADAMVRSDHRRRKLFLRMTRRLLASFGRRVPAFINLSSYVTSATGYLAMGWRNIGSWQVAHRWLSPRRQNTLGPGAAGLPTPFAVLDQRGEGELGGLTLTRHPRPAVMARVVARQRHGACLQPLRDRDFYRWRYRNPLSQYRFLFLRDRGYIALQYPIRRRSRARINVVELEAPTLDEKAALLETAMSAGDFASLALWSGGYSTEERVLLAQLGFTIVDHESAHAVELYCPPILVRPGSRFLRSIPPLSEWRLPGIASDAV